ncbi:hypothetical protein V8D89_005384 [Ganoderma adspersum]
MAYCDRCTRWFGSDQALLQHERTSSYHHLCIACDRDFVSDAALLQHYKKSSRHTYCTLCSELIDHLGISLRQHYEQAHYECPGCNLVFNDESSMLAHCLDVHEDRWCAPCKRMFQNENNLHQHLRSATHQTAKFRCPMTGCGRSFISTSALALHFESGSCPSGITREMVDRFFPELLDKGGIIADPKQLIEGPSSSASPLATTRWWATERTWNGSAYECYLCHRTFKSLVALNAHLGSPTHGDKLYHCPTQFGGCGTEYRTLGAILQHIEDPGRRCAVRRFDGEVNRIFDGLTNSRKWLTGASS